MYSFIEGKIEELNPASAVISCHGVGYDISISLQTYSKIKLLEQCRLYTHLVVREDAMVLFGFADTEERYVFQQLVSVSGVGPNTARLILSSLTPDEVANAIATENVKVLQSIKGIGGKTALRILVDLKDRIKKEQQISGNFPSLHNTGKAEALSALVMLGFTKSMAEKALEQVIKANGNTLPVDQLIKLALKIM